VRLEVAEPFEGESSLELEQIPIASKLGRVIPGID